jgi:transposase-like protein
MSDDGDPWRDGRRTWERLGGWYREGTSVPPGVERDPLAALSDVGKIRRLLDEVELEAVRSARQRGRSWAEIAIKLGVTRQSTWERWRDLDTEREESPRPGGRDVAPQAEPTAARSVLGRAARAARRRAWVTVPNVVGMTFHDASQLLSERGLVGVAPDPGATPSVLLDLQGAEVTDQSPESGAKAQSGAPVRLWTERGGGSGVREPRRPKPKPREARELHEGPAERVVG